MEQSRPSPSSADHLCVLVHGLWGNPSHLGHLEKALKGRFGDKLHILAAKTNAGTFTYDGIELGGERVTREIEEHIEELKRAGQDIRKISIVGYSLGGLVARYAIGLLYSKSWFEPGRLQPMNFTTFASPHLGVRTPLTGFHSQLWNILGARTLSTSGRQLFTIDSFRETGRPLLSLLAGRDSVFIRGLACFKTRSLYANIVNDRSAVYYTTSISATDPFVDMSKININYLPDYSPVILDPTNPVSPIIDEEGPKTFIQNVTSRYSAIMTRLPFIAFLVVFIPLGTAIFLVNAGVQSYRSARRIRLHESGKAGVPVEGYRMPLIVEGVRRGADHIYEGMGARQSTEYLPVEEDLEEDDDYGESQQQWRQQKSDSTLLANPSPENQDLSNPSTIRSAAEKVEQPNNFLSNNSYSNGTVHTLQRLYSSTSNGPGAGRVRRSSSSFSASRPFPLLALTPAQFEMIRNLDEIGFRKFPVHIHKAMHSHAAIIVRMNRKGFDEGRVVVGHWVENFEL